MTLSRSKAKAEKIDFRVDKRTKRMLKADARRRKTSITALLLAAWAAYSPAAAELSRPTP